MTVAAAALVTTATQPKAVGAQSSSGETAGGEFATLLDQATNETTVTDAAAAMMMVVQPTQVAQAFPTQLQASLVGSMVPGPEGDGLDPTVATGEAAAILPPAPVIGEAAVTEEGAEAPAQPSAALPTALPTAQQPTGADAIALTPASAAMAAAGIPQTSTTAAASKPSTPSAASSTAPVQSADAPVTSILPTSDIAKAPVPAAMDAAAQAVDVAQGAQPAPTQNAAQPSASATQSPASSQPAASVQPGATPAATQIADVAAAAVDASAPAPAPAPQAGAADIFTAATAPAADTARAPATPPALQSAPAATLQVYARIIERADGRAQRFEVRLDPAELGRVDVRIEIGADKKVHAVLAAHDSAALTDLMRGQRALERALSDAGIDLADNGVRFEMATDNGRGGAQQQREGEAGRQQGGVWRNFETLTVPVSEDAAGAAVKPSWQPQRLDLVA